MRHKGLLHSENKQPTNQPGTIKLNKTIPEVFSRRISEKWTRFLEEDYLAIPIPTETTEKTDLKNIDKTIENYLCKDEKCRNILRDLTKTLGEG